MSFGSISIETHKTLAVAMNRWVVPLVHPNALDFRKYIHAFNPVWFKLRVCSMSFDEHNRLTYKLLNSMWFRTCFLFRC